jgi:hypothetical protein
MAAIDPRRTFQTKISAPQFRIGDLLMDMGRQSRWITLGANIGVVIGLALSLVVD